MTKNEEIEKMISDAIPKVSNSDIYNLLKKEKELDIKFKSENDLGEFYFDFLSMISILKEYLEDDTTYNFENVIVPIVVALRYVDKSLDDLPDFIPFIGYKDDAAVVEYVINQLKQNKIDLLGEFDYERK